MDFKLDAGGLVQASPKDGEMVHISGQDGLPGQTLQVFLQTAKVTSGVGIIAVDLCC